MAALSRQTANFTAPQTDVDGVVPIWIAGGRAIFPASDEGVHRNVMALLVRLSLQCNMGPSGRCLSRPIHYPLAGRLCFFDVGGKQLYLGGDLPYADDVVGIDFPVS